MEQSYVQYLWYNFLKKYIKISTSNKAINIDVCRFHVELHFSPGVNCCVQKNLPPGPGFRPHSRNDQSKHLSRIDQEDTTTEENSSSQTSTV